VTADTIGSPFRWSEDFGHVTSRCRGALVGLGAGDDHPPLHAPDYDFPDALLLPGVELLDAVVRGLVGSSKPEHA
jgi:metal-dependent amidase/aminoacylase/carboxypeptidase family protein